ncbi:MAG: hypothetical protein WCF35_04990, partial [Pseudolabrys sp.]
VVHSYKGWPIRSRHSRPERDRTDISNVAHWLGLRLAILLRRLSTMRLEHPAGSLDVMRWGMRLRLHPIDNGCEKNLLFTSQMYETTELAALSEEIFRVREQRRKFVFVDIGANVGLF